ncbi:MAG: VWA domain-containing protein [Bryobacteraceae bacterium]
MSFLNLTIPEFLTLLTALATVITALYLLDRTKQKRMVSTLRFWAPALTARDRQRRRRVREPWSLILQLISLVLLLLAIAQMQWGSRARQARDRVLLLDTSAWTAERAADGILLDREKTAARQYLSSLPSRDRVLLARVDALATPVTSFTSNRAELFQALDASEPGFSALNIEQALSLARQARTWSGARQGEVVYIGPKLIADRDGAAPILPNFRAITVQPNRQNCGIRRIGVRKGDDEPNSWRATVTLKNYGSTRRTVRLKTRFAGTAFTPRAFTLAPEEELAAEYNFVTNTAGQLIAEIEPSDNLPSDDRAVLQLPAPRILNLAVYTTRPEVLRPLLEANHRLRVKFFTPSEYAANPAADLILLDRMAPQQAPKIASLWIEPAKEKSPLPVKTVVSDAVIKNWHTDSAIAAGLRAKEARIQNAEIFQTFEGDIPVASLSEGPVVVARDADESRPKIAVIGFDPLSGPLKFEVTTPLLFADLLRWLSPEPFQILDFTADQVGVASLALDPSERPERIRVHDERGLSIPFTIRGRSLQLFVNRPSVVHVASNDRERILSLTLPDIAEFEWSPPSKAAAGLPAATRFLPEPLDLWKWLALLGGSTLFLEWMLFGRRRKFMRPERGPSQVPAPERELVSK